MIDLTIDRDNGVPVGTQLAWRLRTAIEQGTLAPGARLPSLRDAATAAGVNVNTVRAAYTKLEAAGVVTTEQGRGTFVAAAAPPDESMLRRRLRDDIARLEAELVTHPLLVPEPDAGSPQRRGGARLLSVAELTTVRDVLAERVSELQGTRAKIAQRLEDAERARSATAASDAICTPPRRSSSSLAGARVRWTGAH